MLEKLMLSLKRAMVSILSLCFKCMFRDKSVSIILSLKGWKSGLG